MSRLDQLHKLLEKTPNDPFLTYGIALEHKKSNESDQALAWLEKTITIDAKYCYAYYQKGQVLEHVGDAVKAREAYQQGIDAAHAVGDRHAESELQSALDALE